MRAGDKIMAADQADGTPTNHVEADTGYRASNVLGDGALQVPKSHHGRPPSNPGLHPTAYLGTGASARPVTFRIVNKSSQATNSSSRNPTHLTQRVQSNTSARHLL